MTQGGASQDWEAPALVLSASLFGEANALVHLFTEERGVVHGLVRGGLGRRNGATWQTGNAVRMRRTARLPDQLGTVTGELLHATAAGALSSRLAVMCLSSVCAVADAALPEGEPYQGLYHDTERVLAATGGGLAEADPGLMIATVLRWERALLQDLGFALNLSRCAVTGQTTKLIYVSPRTGCAVSAEGAGEWVPRLLPLPSLFLNDADNGTEQDWQNGLQLTGHFLRRDVFGPLHRNIPAARIRLADYIASLAGQPSGEETADLG